MDAKKIILIFLLFLFPLFFLPITQEFFITNKLYLLAFAGLILILVSSLELLFSKKLVWEQRSFDKPLIIFILAVALSIIISSPNKIAAILNPSFGLLGLLGLAILYFYLSRATLTSKVRSGLLLSSALLSILTIIFFFQPFKNINLPAYFQFLKNPSFTPLGNQLDLAIFLGFFLVWGATDAIVKKQFKILNSTFLILNLLALLLTLYSLIKSYGQNSVLSLQLPPFNISWYAAVETLKNPMTALFGVGIDNFASMFTRAKDLLYNQTPLWQINSFSVSRSTILQIFTETGLFGLVAFGLLLLTAARVILGRSPATGGINSATTPESDSGQARMTKRALAIYLFLVLIFFPPSLPVFFLLFIFLSVIASEAKQSHEIATSRQGGTRNDNLVDLSELLPVYLGMVLVGILVVLAASYLLGRSYLAEYYFKKSQDAVLNNNLKDLYDNQRQGIILNPYIERFRSNFSQTNLILANNVAAKGKDLTDQDRGTIAQAIQAAIAEAKATVALNPQKASNWENLAAVYRNILAVAQGADVWTISAYQRAIILDPQNPIYRLNLGGVYYSLAKYDDGLNFFQQATALKPDWPNAHYNLAWAAYQKADYQLATNEMQTVIALLNPAQDKVDYDKAKKDLDQFKAKLPKSEQGATGAGQLKLPQAPEPSISPKITLPQNASPEAK